MKVFSTSLSEKLKKLDFVIIACAFGMTIISVLTLFPIRHDFVGSSKMYIIQTLAAILGFCGMVFIALFDYDAIVTKLWIPLVFASLTLLVIVLIFGEGPKGKEDQKLYLDLGIINIQPSEFVKIMFILSFSKHIDLVKENINHPKSWSALCLHAGLIIGTMLLTGDLGTTLVFICIFAAMMYAGGLSLWYYAGAVGVAVIAFPYIWPYLGEYQQMRILCGFDPYLDPEHYGYQAIKSINTISAGGFWGAGIFGGSEYKTLPVATTDFLFSVMCEKFGFFGAFLYLTLMLIMILRIVKIARTSRKDTGAYICVGVITILIAQTTENMGMCLGMLPVIGITMPFMSYGGSSMLAMWLTVGLAQSVRLHNTKYYFERERA